MVGAACRSARAGAIAPDNLEPVSWMKIVKSRNLIPDFHDFTLRLGAKRAYVISDQVFYRRLGFVEDRHYTFYRLPRSSV